MPKMKTSSGAAKRLKKTKSGKIKYKKANLRHILTSKSPKNKRQSRKAGYLTNSDANKIKGIISYR